MSFGLYVIGVIILMAGVLYACHLAHVPDRWVMVIALVLLGAGVMGGVARTRSKDPS
jgi:hypothetical protein